MALRVLYRRTWATRCHGLLRCRARQARQIPITVKLSPSSGMWTSSGSSPANLTVDVAYVGTHGYQEEILRDINQPAIGTGWNTGTECSWHLPGKQRTVVQQMHTQYDGGNRSRALCGQVPVP